MFGSRDLPNWTPAFAGEVPVVGGAASFRVRRSRWWLVGAALTIATPAAAQTQAQMNQAEAAKFARADAAMTRQWKATYAAMKRRDAGDASRGGGFGYAAATLESQRAWLRYRDTQCVIEAGRYAGGSMQPMVAASCRATLTEARRAQLREMLWNDM